MHIIFTNFFPVALAAFFESFSDFSATVALASFASSLGLSDFCCLSAAGASFCFVSFALAASSFLSAGAEAFDLSSLLESFFASFLSR